MAVKSNLFFSLAFVLLFAGAQAMCATNANIISNISALRANAGRLPICERALTCLRNQMVWRINNRCTSPEEFGSFMGGILPGCYRRHC